MKANKIVAMSSKSARGTAFVAILSLALACGSSYPSASAGRKFLENMGRRPKTQQTYKVKSFRKTNGLVEQGIYILEYEAEIECSIAGKYIDIPGFLVACEEAGQIHKISGQTGFVKTENGWRAPDGNIY